MRKIAIILLIIFTLVQAGPVCCTLFSETTAIFIADEEKAPEKSKTDKKADNKDYITFQLQLLDQAGFINISFHHIENIQFPPYLEKLSPPPNFC
ncbi:MAG TPA: hypothetical protein PKC54_00755 [Ferruginibacter sp.]|nr:hypothetical protein [Ferruginibacter sp.]